MRYAAVYKPNSDQLDQFIKRKGDKLFAYGECTRAILNALRDAWEPVTTADLVERVALDCRIATEAPDVAAR